MAKKKVTKKKVAKKVATPEIKYSKSRTAQSLKASRARKGT